MINQVYTTVLAIINKDNRGYISPLEFNLYAEFAQMSLFEELFHKYSKSIVKQNARMYHSEFSDIPKHIREVIDIFTDETSLTPLVVLDPLNTLWKPLDSNFYRMIKMDYRGKEIEEISKLEINRILNNNLVQPTIDYPAYVSLKGAYRIYPTSVVKNDVIVTYIRKPSQPKWTYTSVAGNP